MKNKFLLSILIMFLVIASLGSVFAKDIAYIAKDSNHLDSAIVSLIEQRGYTYDVIYQNALNSANFSNYTIILVGEGTYNDYSKIPVNKKNSVILNTYYLDEWGWTATGTSIIASNRPKEVVVYDSGSSITEGISESFVPYYENGVMISYQVNYIPNAKDAPGLSTIVADDLTFLQYLGIYRPRNGAVVATINNGSKLRENQVSKARGVFIGFQYPDLWTEETKNIFYNSIEWAITGDDRDQDGFYIDFDCDDNNPDANPDGIEIPYDGIDQDCSGSDLNDLDEDGFIADIAGGDDCDDNDFEYNPGSLDLTKNCINDAPIISSINRISVSETEKVNFTIHAEDPEENELEYFINDARFSQEENYFEWETDYNDAGDYNFNVTVTDGELESYKLVSVKVWNKNKAPELTEEIPVQEWAEDETHSLNLSQYFYDLDSNQIHYYVNSTSKDLNITVSKTGEDTFVFTSKKDWYGEDWIIFSATDLLGVQNTNNITLRVFPVNDAPFLVKEIGDLVFKEDEIYELNLEGYFSDVDSELEYSFDSTPHTEIILEEGVLRIIPDENWFGQEEAEITANDEEFGLKETFNIIIESVNDAPEIEDIEDMVLLAGDYVEIIAVASDIEEDEIIFGINSSDFSQDENLFFWQTDAEDYGKHVFEISAYDRTDYEYKNVNVNVLQKVFINEFVYGLDGWVELYNPKEITFGLEDCILKNSDNEELLLNGLIAPNGFAVFDWDALQNSDFIELNCFDDILINKVNYEDFEEGDSLGRMPDGSEQEGSFILFEYPTKGLSNSADVIPPETNLILPENNTLITESREISFEFIVFDNMAEELECILVVNNKNKASKRILNNTEDSLYSDDLNDGIYEWSVFCNDGFNKGYSEKRTLNLSAPDNPVLEFISEKKVSEGQELRFIIYGKDADGEDVKFTIKNKPEEANFTDNLDNSAEFAWIPNYNQSGNYEVEFEIEDSSGLKDSQKVNIEVKNIKEPPKFSDAEICSLKNDSIIIEIRDPDKGDEFEIGDTIKGELRIKNNLKEDIKLELKIYLYDLEEEDSVKKINENLRVKDRDSETLDFEIEIPNDIENEEFALYVYAEDKNGLCNSAYKEIEILRKDHDVVIERIEINPSIVSSGDEIEVVVDVKNLGTEEEEAYIKLEIPEIKFSKTSEKFDIEEFGEDDEKTERFFIVLPSNLSEKEYELKASVFFGKESNYSVMSFDVLNRVAGEDENDDKNEVPASTLITLGGSSGKIIALKTSKTSLDSQVKITPEKTKPEEQPNVRIEFKEEKVREKKTDNTLFSTIAIALAIGIAIIILIIILVLLFV